MFDTFFNINKKLKFIILALILSFIALMCTKLTGDNFTNIIIALSGIFITGHTVTDITNTKILNSKSGDDQ